ncbi:hypothetical protein HALLA_17005 [Halostagnicola larsenii XH-48]|uniref:DUF92 domain-containing protein n=1 Tax=Halostagnicola larsenii XH-48 TaxID=797299 RepID=W0JNF5_9EURY|nr:DUF92 domain-containing protein [Halostagnicola larsenii]AHG00246.1 hypothetical protein HALLA_17005 [Halostagnicola larsenii XH-48]
MTAPVWRAGAFAVLSTLSLALPLFGPEPTLILASVVILGALIVTDGRLFDLLAYPDDYEDGRLYGVIAFVFGAGILGFFTTAFSMPVSVLVGTVVLVGYGNLAERLARRRVEHGVRSVTAFCVGGAVAGVAGQIATLSIVGDSLESALPAVLFLAASGVLLAALLRDVLLLYDDPVIMLSVGLLLWLLAELETAIGPVEILAALAVTIALGYVSYALDTASIAGMLTGILLGLLTIVLGGYGWFVVLISFFGIGGLSTKFRYDEKETRGVAEDNDGARGSGNVLGNSAVGVAAVLGYAASSADMIPTEPELFLFAFAGSVAAAMSDTLSSEVGSVFDRPLLITTLEPVDPGTDGGVTWQGTVAGFVGAAIVAVLSFGFFAEVDAAGTAIIATAGFVGMLVDSVLGATLEGTTLGNQGVNFLATLSGAIFCALVVLSMAALA